MLGWWGSKNKPQRKKNRYLAQWPIDPDLIQINHGSFGQCPTRVLEAQTQMRNEMERNTMGYFVSQLPEKLEVARQAAAAFVGADADDLVFVSNNTTGVNCVLKSLTFSSGDEILVTDTEYNATRNVVDAVATKNGASVVVAKLGYPITSAEQIVDSLVRHVTARTRLVVLDHVTSQTALVLPLETILPEMAARHVDVLIDGAHAPGMLPMAVAHWFDRGATYYTGTFHKWVCAPKGSAFLAVRADRQTQIHPVVTSHGYNDTRTSPSKYQIEFGWTGTDDPTAPLCVPTAIDELGSWFPGGWDALRQRNHTVICEARRTLLKAWGNEDTPLPCPDDMLGSMAVVPLPRAWCEAGLDGGKLHDDLLQRHHIETQYVQHWPGAPHPFLRLSAHLYNDPSEYEVLASALLETEALPP